MDRLKNNRGLDDLGIIHNKEEETLNKIQDVLRMLTGYPLFDLNSLGQTLQESLEIWPAVTLYQEGVSVGQRDNQITIGEFQELLDVFYENGDIDIRFYL